MEEICIKQLTLHRPNRKDISFHGHLFIETSNTNSEIFLRIYGKYHELITVSNFLGRNDIPDLLEIDDSDISDDHIDSIKICSSHIIGILDNSDFVDKIGKYVLLELKEVIIYRKPRESELDKSKRINSYFHLSEQSIALLADNYFYKINNVGSWNADPRNKRFHKFKEIWYRFELLFPVDESFHRGGEKVTINRKPVLHIRYEKDLLNVKYPDSIILLLSFYLKESIKYYFGFYYIGDQKVEHYKHVTIRAIRNRATTCRHSDFDSIYSFIGSVKRKDYLIKNYSTVKAYIERFILSAYLFKESKFMVYFSIIEGVRNEFLKEEKIKIKENFTFNSGAKEKIKETVNIISEYVSSKEKELLLNL